MCLLAAFDSLQQVQDSCSLIGYIMVRPRQKLILHQRTAGLEEEVRSGGEGMEEEEDDNLLQYI